MERWQLIEELFAETVELDAAERRRALQARAGNDAELIRSVEALVAADRSPLPALDRTATDVLVELRDAPPADALCGQVFGPYRIEAHLSTGGMGHVYRATRTSAGTQRRVALKVLRPGLDTEAFLARFSRERRTLAALEHEHVVAFLDAGALPDGRPYLVMEYVDGLPLTEWARRSAAPRRARIELFLQILAAVQYAHQELVVHRDLKPSNILVTASGAPKLLDFGVAAALTEQAGDADNLTPLTPSYASPEQRAGGPVGTASDVYSLGVVLHELLTGALPFPDRAPALGADLDAIVRQALEQDPRRRYASADRFADDLRRHLACAPVAARADGWTYRASRFARRNRWPLALAAAAVVALVAGWIGADLARRAAERDAGVGWGAHAQAKRASRIFEDCLAAACVASPELGAAAAARLESVLRDELATLPETETMVRLALARLYLDRGERGRAAGHAERAGDLARTTHGVSELERRRAAELRARAEAGG